MQYRQLGNAGLKVSELSFGSWLTFGDQIGIEGANACMRYAYEQGVNFFDNAEVYANGKAEEIMGQALKSFRRESLVVSTKIFWGGEGPNDVGLSRKHLLEGTRNSLKRLQLEYVDLLFCHRPDPSTPIEETVRAMDHLVRSGQALYWGTSEWSAQEIESAYQIAEQLGCIPPSMEQSLYNLFHRRRVEEEYTSLYKKYGMGLTTFSPLASGVLSGKYNKGTPKDSRLGKHPVWRSKDAEQRIQKVIALEPVAKSLQCTLSQLAIAWCLKNNNVSSVILGATNLKQLQENLAAVEVAERITEEELKAIAQICNMYKNEYTTAG